MGLAQAVSGSGSGHSPVMTARSNFTAGTVGSASASANDVSEDPFHMPASARSAGTKQTVASDMYGDDFDSD